MRRALLAALLGLAAGRASAAKTGEVAAPPPQAPETRPLQAPALPDAARLAPPAAPALPASAGLERLSAQAAPAPGALASAPEPSAALARAFDGAVPTRPIAVPATQFEQRDLSVAGVRLRYIDEGKGSPVLLIHGHTSRVEEYEDLVSRLKASHRVLVCDLPGSGYSDKPARDYSLSYYEEVLLGFLDALGLRKVSVAGGSQGGNLALRLAARAPERVEKVAAWSPGSAWTAHPWAAAAIRAVGGKALFWTVVERQSKYWYSPGFPGAQASLDHTFAYYREIMSPGFIRMYWGIAADTVGTSLFAVAPRIKAPTLLLRGGFDGTPGMAAGVERLHRGIPGSRLVVYPDSGHAIANEKPAELARELLEFLSPATATKVSDPRP